MLIRSPIVYGTREKISFADLFDGRLALFDIQEHIEEGRTSDTFRCLADGYNHVWVAALGDGTVDRYHTYLDVASGGIFGAISYIFDVQFFSEHEYQFWGFDSAEKMEEFWKKRADEDEGKFYAELIKYVAGEPNDIAPGTSGMNMANIAKDIVAEDPGFVLPDRKTELMEAIENKIKEEEDREISFQAIYGPKHEEDLPW